MRILVFGNSGSGKSVYARGLAARHAIPHLDLDTIVWEPGKIAVPRDPAAVRADLDAFIAAHPGWVVEGCYGELVAAAQPHCTRLVFLDPGLEACLENNRRRPWEPHKYATPEAQQAMLAPLLDWVAAYYTRDDDWSHARHRALFEAHAGDKRRYAGMPDPAD